MERISHIQLRPADKPYTLMCSDVDMARQYGIVRSTSRALLNVAVRAGSPGSERSIVSSVTARALDGQARVREIRMREVVEGAERSYLGEVPLDGNETLDFQIEVTPKETGRTIHAAFRQEFFVQ